MSILDKELIEAYKLTDFHVKSKPLFTLNVNYQSQELLDMFKQHNVSSAAFITAWNPYSKSMSETENAERNLMLHDVIVNDGYVLINGFGQDPLEEWPGEDSYLVLGLDLEYSKVLGIKFSQNAIVWCDSSAVPELVLLR